MRKVNHKKNLIEVRDVSFAYAGATVLEDITFDIHEGDYLGVVGPNGSGKTTLIKIILGLIRPQKGTVKIFGKELKDFRDWKKIGYVPQKAAAFDVNFPATVFETVLMARPRRFGRGLTKADLDAAKRALNNTGTWDLRDRLIGDLSGGQQQRVMIARALVNAPNVIFLDEPTTGIDQRSQDEFYALVKSLNDDMNITIVIVSHDLGVITKEVEHIACIDRTLVCHSTPAEFLRDTTATDLFGDDIKLVTHHHHHHKN